MVIESTLIGALTGFGGSLFNGILGYFQQKQQNEHQIKQWDHDLKILQAQSDLKLQEYEARAADDEHARLLDHDKSIDGIRALVRPILTAVFVAGYLAQVILIMTGTMPVLDPQQIAVLSDFNLITSAIMTFWFGSRGTEKSLKIMKGL